MDTTYTAHRISDLMENERPRERLAERGSKALSLPELLAILIRTGLPGENAVQVGARLLKELGGLAGLQRVTYQDICEQKGIGPAKAAQIMAAIELGNRIATLPFEQRDGIHSPAEAAEMIMYEMSALEQEQMWVLCLDTRNRLIRREPIYQGSVNSSQVRVGELFKFAVRHNATSIIVAHNHPSGDPTPSPDDVAVTRAIVQAGKLLDIDVLDHLVIGQGRFVSLKDRGLGF